MSVNKVILLGNVGKDPQSIASNPTTICKFSLATTEKWTDKNGQKQEKTEWHNVVAFDGQARVILDHVKMGRQLYVEGRLQTSSYEKDGVKKYSTEIVMTGFSFVSGSKVDDHSTTEKDTSSKDELITTNELPF